MEVSGNTAPIGRGIRRRVPSRLSREVSPGSWFIVRETTSKTAKPAENPAEILDESDDKPHNKQEGDEEDEWVVDDQICTDGGTVVSFFDASQPQPCENSRRVWYVDDPT